MPKVTLDAIDRKILQYLIKNARMPFLEIARECGISGAAIHQRVKKLDDSGVILGSRLEVDPTSLGFDVCAIIGIRVSDPSMNIGTVEALKQIPEIVECHFITGQFNILIKLYCVDNEHLMRTIFDHVLTVPSISNTETFISLNQAFSRQVNVEDLEVNQGMSVIRLTKEFSFEMAHALEGYDGACSQIHGHSYKLFVTVQGSPLPDPAHPKFGMVMDFGMIKALVNRVIVSRYDHALVLRGTDANKPLTDTLKKSFERIEVVDYQPTCENMVARFADLIAAELPEGVRLWSVRLHETATSYAEWFFSDNG